MTARAPALARHAAPSGLSALRAPALWAALLLGAGLALPPAPAVAADKALAESVGPKGLAGATQNDAAVPQPPFTLAVKALLETELAARAGEQRIQDLAALQSLYRDFGWRPLWTSAAGAGAAAEALVGALAAADTHGLDPEDYGTSALAALIGATRPDLRAEFEVRLGLGLMAYASDLSRGRTEPGEVFAENHVTPAPIERVAILTRLEGLSAAAATARLAALAPGLPEYDRLRRALAALRAEAREAQAPGAAWPRVADGETLDPGGRDPRAAQLRARLLASGDLAPEDDAARDDPAARTLYDPALAAALRGFQARHGLAVDGRVGPNTLEALNVPLAARIRQIQLNLERLRWMPDDLGESHLLVNLADFSVTGTFGGERLYWTRAVVGTPYNRTPVFSDTMEYLEINPYWNVPNSIATEELLPKIKADPGYLAAHDYELLTSWSDAATPIDPALVDWSQVTAANFPYRIRQKPGAQNALGRIKFMFPNRFNVYLHDTPARRLFDRPRRAFSHGCVRLDKPLELAEILLRDDPDWDRARIERTVASGARTLVALPEPVPVHLTYLTAWVDADRRLQFRGDIYERDRALAAALLEPRAHLN